MIGRMMMRLVITFMAVKLAPLIFSAVLLLISGVVLQSYSPVKKQMGHFLTSIC